jgi:hypothetical protein
MDKSHGRIERRHLTARALLPGDCNWPGAQQVFRLERRVIRLKTGEIHTEVLVGLTSRPAAGAGLSAELLAHREPVALGARCTST